MAKATTLRKGFVIPAVWYGVLLLGVIGVWLFKPKALDGDSKRAAASAKTTQQVIVAEDNKGANAAASVQKIQEVNAQTPASPSKTFIERESGVALSYLPSPSPQALLEAEKRRSAVFEGKLDVVDSLYAKESQTSQKLRDQLTKAITAKESVDQELAQVAAERLGEGHERNMLIAAVVLALALWGYSKIFSITPSTLGNMVADIRAGADPVTTFDTHLAPWLHKSVNTAARLATPVK